MCIPDKNIKQPMSKIVKAFINNPFYGRMVIVLLLALGVFSYSSMMKSSFPEEESKTINVSVFYPGATPKQMEEGVTTLIENALRGIPGIKETTSTSVENMSNVIVTVQKDVKTEGVLTEVKNAVDGISNLPGGADRPIVNWQKRRSPAAFFSMSGDMSLIELKKRADIVEDELLNSGKVSQITISGAPSLEIAIEVNQETLSRYGLTFEDIRQAVAANNLDMAGGVIRNPREEMNILSRMRSIKPDDIEKIVVRASNAGSVIRVEDVASVKYQFQESPTAFYIDGKPALQFSIMKLNTEDLIEISESIENYITEFNEQNDDVHLEMLFDFSTILKSRLDILVNNGIIGIILVLLFLSLFLNIRLAFWVAWGIPASFLGMFVIASMAGVTINMISLFGMIMVIGILVDDGVVIGENIYSHFEKGKSPRRAALDGSLEVMPAIFTSVTTTMVAFLPLMLLKGNMSMMFEMALVVIACLGMSIFEGVFVLPSHLSHKRVLDSRKEIGFLKSIRGGIDKFLFRFRDKMYVPFVRRLIRYKWAAVAFTIACLMLTAGLVGGGKIGTTFFPNVEDDYFTIDLALKPGTSTQITEAYLKRIEVACREVSAEMTEEYNEDAEIIKFLEMITGSAFNGSESGTHAGNIAVLLKSIEDVQWSVAEIKRRIHKKIGHIPDATKFAVGASSRWGAPVSISLLSRNEEQLMAATVWFKSQLSEITALYNIMDNNRVGNQEVRILPKEQAYALGLTQQSLMAQVGQGFFGGQAQRLVHGKNEVRVYVRYKRDNRQMLGQLENMKITTPSGIFPLHTLADLSLDRSPVAINRLNGRREITVEAYQRNPNEPLTPITDIVNTEVLPQIKEKFPEVDFTFRGQMKDSQEETGELLSGFSIAFLIIVLIIMGSFKSFYQGILIIIVIPLGWIAAIWGHGIEGHPISLLSAFGMIALSGTIINDAVVYLAKFNQNMKEGMKLVDAVVEAGRSRFRPILLTSLTTVAGLYPLILETSMQAKFLVPMAVALAYGIFFGTILIMLFFPVYIVCGNSIRLKVINLFRREARTPESIEPVVVAERIKNEEENI